MLPVIRLAILKMLQALPTTIPLAAITALTFWMAAQVAARQCDNSFRDKLGRYVAGHADDADRRRKAMTALTAKMARVAHAVVKTGTEYRPFLERPGARWKDPSLQVP